MILKNIIQRIETLYKNYLEQNSENLFNANTDFFFEKIYSIPICNQILEELILHNKVKIETFENRENLEPFDYIYDIVSQGEKYYIAYCIQYYHFLHEKKISGSLRGERYYDDVLWTENDNSPELEKMNLFRSGFIRPIVNYLTGNIKNESVIIDTIQRYKQRVERFKSIMASQTLTEHILQRDLALFLFDNHLEFDKEVDTCDGRIDFKIGGDSVVYGTILECNDKPYIVEVKYLDKKEKLSSIDDAKGQLRIYMEQVPSYGCLLIYTNDETDYELSDWSDNQITVISVYIGDNTPSRRHYRPAKG